MAETLAIETRSLNKVYSSGRTEVVALREATLKIPKGQVAAFLGPSGSGKSTLLTIIGLVIPPTSGQVLINGELIVDGSHAKTNLRNYRLQNVGFVFQKANLIPFLSAIENVQIAMELNHTSSFKARRRAAE